jgi:hypothetical protein
MNIKRDISLAAKCSAAVTAFLTGAVFIGPYVAKLFDHIYDWSVWYVTHSSALRLKLTGIGLVGVLIFVVALLLFLFVDSVTTEGDKRAYDN